ncbi:phenylacetate--CoA ligase family protein [Marinihelvus fidelis]|uniref:Phenylacetate--CoA ligase family protein n=1 Tax=Marinihelvus fidelis TaxID=2613842 RepID=A0A5N0TEK4_9GAMM|nr:phenylacetate--CoA ligase family protein [Marinihelvus fidelis]KAA9133058.1 phenylacetate--CoA ligase family protein [Marinihelvus fidelis]
MKVETIYRHLPVSAQNLALSFKGHQLKRQRFGGQFSERLELAMQRTNWSVDRVEQYQLDQLNQLLSHAKTSSPYYENLLKDSPRKFSSLSELGSLPVLEKASLREQTDAIRSNAFSKSSLIKINTSGTTGTPLNLGFTPADLQERHATLYRFYAWYCIHPGVRNARFSGKPIFDNTRNGRVFWRKNASGNQLLMSSYHLHPDNASAYLEALTSFQPELMDGYPSMMCFVARKIVDDGRQGCVKPKLIMSTAEQLDPSQRSLLEEAFQCPVANFYSSSEGAPFITEAPNGELVINSDSGVFEFVKPGTESSAGPGEFAELLVTSFTSYAYPLIRYRIGDTVTVPEKPSFSSFVTSMPVIGSINGRRDDILWTRHRGEVVALNRIFSNVPSTILESQVVQQTPDKVLFRYVPDIRNGFSLNHLDSIKHEILQRLGPVEIRCESFESLPRGANGKLRAVIREF